MSIVVLHLYPRELGINGDVGNVMALAKRADWRGMPLTVVDHEIGAALPELVHLVHIGSGPVSAQLAVHDDVLSIASTLRRWADDGVPFLAIAGGWQLLGRSLTLDDGQVLEGAGVFPTDATLTTRRQVDEVWTSDAAGFENHAATTTIAGGTPFADGRGVRVGDRVATVLHGPFLPMNPAWADDLLAVAAARAGIPMVAADDRLARADEYAAKARDAIRRRLRL